VEVGVADLAVAVSTAVGSVQADTSQVELAIADEESASAECASRVVLRALRAQDRASLRLGIHRTRSLFPAVLQLRARQLQGSRIPACRTFAITSYRNMMQTGITTGTGGMPTLTTVASSFLSMASGAV